MTVEEERPEPRDEDTAAEEPDEQAAEGAPEGETSKPSSYFYNP